MSKLIGVTFHYADGEEEYLEEGVIAIQVDFNEDEVGFCFTDDLNIEEVKDAVGIFNECLQNGDYEEK